jgi:hypothetical protein
LRLLRSRRESYPGPRRNTRRMEVVVEKDGVLGRAMVRAQDRVTAVQGVPRDTFAISSHLADESAKVMFSGLAVDAGEVNELVGVTVEVGLAAVVVGGMDLAATMQGLCAQFLLLGYFAAEEAARREAASA